jgi:uncharacterized membrane protein YoaK (UPF0700 family)
VVQIASAVFTVAIAGVAMMRKRRRQRRTRYWAPESPERRVDDGVSALVMRDGIVGGLLLGVAVLFALILPPSVPILALVVAMTADFWVRRALPRSRG